MDTVQKLFRFLDESPTCYHAAANAKAALTAAGACAKSFGKLMTPMLIGISRTVSISS